MKRLLLTLLLLGCLLPAMKADASGSNTVFFPVRAGNFTFTSALHDLNFSKSVLFNYFESADRNTMLVARVNPYLYRTTYYYTYYGYKVDLGFDDYQTVTFQYYSTLHAIVGVTQNDELVVLLPQVPSRPDFGQGHLKD